MRNLTTATDRVATKEVLVRFTKNLIRFYVLKMQQNYPKYYDVSTAEELACHPRNITLNIDNDTTYDLQENKFEENKKNQKKGNT